MFKNKDKEAPAESNLRVGAQLREAREARGLEISEIAAECKLQEKFLTAVEEGHTDYLPSHIYFRMFARLYADTVGLDPDQLLGRLFLELPEPEFPATTNSVERASSPAGEALPIQGTPLERRQPVELRLPINNGPAAGSQLGMSLAYSLSGNRALITKSALAVAVLILVYIVGKTIVVNNSVAGNESEAVISEEITTEALLDVSPGLPAYQPQGELELTIRALGDSETLIIADGDTLLHRVIKKGETISWKSKYRFHLSVAKSEMMEIYLGGARLTGIPVSKGAIENFEINQLNYQSFLSAPVTENR